MVEKILLRYGKPIQVGEQTVMGFLQPVTGKGANMAQVTAGAAGLEQRKQYVYIGPLEPALELDDVLESENRAYIVRRAERIDGIGGAVYQWAMCVEKGAEDTWGLNG